MRRKCGSEAPRNSLDAAHRNTAESADVLTPQEQNITPWSVTGEIGEDGKVRAIDYNKLVDQFGTNLIDEALLERFCRITGKEVHRFLRRQITILDRYEKKQPFFLYTGRGPSSEDIGHVTPFELIRWLLDVFDTLLIIMLIDGNPDYEHYTCENAKDIIVTSLDLDRTFIFWIIVISGDFYRNVIQISKVYMTFNFTSSTNIGKVYFPAIQAASSFVNSFPEVFGSDLRTATITHSFKFLNTLQGPGSKMSAFIDPSAIKVTDSPKQILKKMKGTFSEGKETVEEHCEKRNDPEVDVSYQYLRSFLEDDEELKQIRQDYRSGKLLTNEIKQRYADKLTKYYTAFQERRAKITEEATYFRKNF
ncbi:tryptophanyl-tRNA synthetase [Xylogone sp. PMI_703]|nr:tryptophanyl-tRNA synthetase [Xylogone sp. PMI_703]